MTKIKIVFIVLVPLLLLIALTVLRVDSVREQVPPPPPSGARPSTETNPKYVQLVEKWKKYEFLGLGDEANVGGVVRRIPISGVKLQNEINNKLRASFAGYVRAMHNPTFDVYRRFLLPSDAFTADEEMIGYHVAHLKRMMENVGSLPKDPIDIFKMRHSLLKKNEKGEYWTGVCLDGAGIEVKEMITHPPILGQRFVGHDVAGIREFAPTFIFRDSLANVCSRNGKVYVATAYVVVKTLEADPPYPFICSWYWSDNENEWLPFELAVGFAGPLSTRPAF